MTPLQLPLPAIHETATFVDIVRQADFDLDEVPLHDITQRFTEHLEAGRDGDLDATGEFVAIVARLMLQKSQALLPGPTWAEDEREEALVGDKPTFLPNMREIVDGLGARQGMESYPALAPSPIAQRKLEPWTAGLLHRALQEIQTRQGPRKLELAAAPFIRLEVALSRLLRHLRQGRPLSLRAILGRSNRREVVVHFLAVLELVRRRQVVARQNKLFDDIRVERLDRNKSISARAG